MGNPERRFRATAPGERGLSTKLAGWPSAPAGHGAHPETVRLLTVLSTAAWRMRTPPDWDAARRHAEAAVQAAEGLEAPVGACAPLWVRCRRRSSPTAACESRSKPRCVGWRRPSDPGSTIREATRQLRGAGSALMYVGEYKKAIPRLLEAEAIAVRVQSADQMFNVLALLTQCWLRLDRWDELLSSEEEWEDFEQRHPQERTGPVCFPLALRAAVYARRGDDARSHQSAGPLHGDHGENLGDGELVTQRALLSGLADRGRGRVRPRPGPPRAGPAGRRRIRPAGDRPPRRPTCTSPWPTEPPKPTRPPLLSGTCRSRSNRPCASSTSFTSGSPNEPMESGWRRRADRLSRLNRSTAPWPGLTIWGRAGRPVGLSSVGRKRLSLWPASTRLGPTGTRQGSCSRPWVRVRPRGRPESPSRLRVGEAKSSITAQGHLVARGR